MQLNAEIKHFASTHRENCDGQGMIDCALKKSM